MIATELSQATSSLVRSPLFYILYSLECQERSVTGIERLTSESNLRWNLRWSGSQDSRVEISFELSKNYPSDPVGISKIFEESTHFNRGCEYSRKRVLSSESTSGPFDGCLDLILKPASFDIRRFGFRIPSINIKVDKSWWMLSLGIRLSAAPSGDLGTHLPYQKGFVVVRIRCEFGKKSVMSADDSLS